MLSRDCVAERLVAVPYGTALLSLALPGWYEGNQVRVERLPAGWDAEAIWTDIERVHADAGLTHRRVAIVEPSLVEPLTALAARAPGWDVVRLVAMVRRHRADRPPQPAAVDVLDAEDYADIRRRQLAAYEWARPPGIVDQMLAADAREDASERVRRFGVRGEDGELVGFASLLRFGGAGEIDNVEVLEPFRGRGYGRAVVAATADAATAASCEPVFLVADADDERAVGLYTALGFEPEERYVEMTLAPGATSAGT
jgi:ribosomal protein S18 acetylase RimI-like enzyme